MLADGLAVGVADGVDAGEVGLAGGAEGVADAVALAVRTAVVAVGGGGGAVPVGDGRAALTVALGVASGRRASAPPPHPIDNESSALSDTAARYRVITPRRLGATLCWASRFRNDDIRSPLPGGPVRGWFSASMSRGVRFIARSALLLAGVLLTALLVAAAVVRLPPIQRWVAARVSERLPAGITVEGVTPTVMPPGVRLANVTLGTDEVVLGSVSCHVRVPALLAGRIEVGEVVVDGATMNVDRAADGSINVGASTALLAAPYRQVARLPVPLAAVPPLRIIDGSLTFTDQTARDSPRALHLTGARLTVGPATDSGLPFALSARCVPAGEVSAQGSIRQVAASNGPPDYAVEAPTLMLPSAARSTFTVAPSTTTSLSSIRPASSAGTRTWQDTEPRTTSSVPRMTLARRTPGGITVGVTLSTVIPAGSRSDTRAATQR